MLDTKYCFIIIFVFVPYFSIFFVTSLYTVCVWSFLLILGAAQALLYICIVVCLRLFPSHVFLYQGTFCNRFYMAFQHISKIFYMSRRIYYIPRSIVITVSGWFPIRNFILSSLNHRWTMPRWCDSTYVRLQENAFVRWNNYCACTSCGKHSIWN